MRLRLGRLSQDGQEHWGPPLAMVESFVDPQLFQGTADKVSGWSHFGRTAGWKRDVADCYRKHDTPKQIWVRERTRKACVKLRAPPWPSPWASAEWDLIPRGRMQAGEIRSLRDSAWRCGLAW